MMRVLIKQPNNQPFSLFQQQLEKSIEALPQFKNITLQNEIGEQIKYREDKVFNLYKGEGKDYLESMWNHMSFTNPQTASLINDPANQRINSVMMDISSSRLQIPEKQSPSHGCDHSKLFLEQFKAKSKEKTDEGEEKDIMKQIYSKQKIQQTKKYIQKERQKRAERKKKWKQLKAKEQEQFLKEEKHLKEEEERKKQEKRQQILKKQKDRHVRRDEEKVIRERRKSQFFNMKQKLNESPPLYWKMSERYGIENKIIEKQRNERMIHERKHLLEHLTKKEFQEHEKKYAKFKIIQEKQRNQRRKLMKQQQKQIKKKHFKSVEFTKRVDRRQVEREIGKEKIQKIRQFRKKVQEKYKPKIDEDKKSELLNLIEKLSVSRKRVKNVKLQNGLLSFENLNNVDSKSIGNEYLGEVRQMVAKSKSKLEKKAENEEQEEEKKVKSDSGQKRIDYLAELKQMRKNRTESKKKIKHSYDDDDLNDDEKFDKFYGESEKLTEKVKQKERSLMYNQYKPEIERLKEELQIEENYIDIVNLKLKLLE